MSKRHETIWAAEPHTLAKIEILKGYLHAWFRILGMRRKDEVLLFVDGFAGPGRYSGGEKGSPVAALDVAVNALENLGTAFIGNRLHCAFIEKDQARFAELSGVLANIQLHPKLKTSRYNCEFVEGINQLRREIPGPFRGSGPLLVFADPFGGTGIPLTTIASCLEGASNEVLINLDADGVARIFTADNPNREQQLDDLFGSGEWRTVLHPGRDFAMLSLDILQLYKKSLRTIPGVKYLWSFAMRGAKDLISYHLVFASKHPQGLRKMKEAMRRLSGTNAYTFSDADVGQHALFTDDEVPAFADKMWRAFDGRAITYAEADLFALNDSPFLNPKEMLQHLEKTDRLQVDPVPGVPRRKGTFAEEAIRQLRFGRYGCTDVQLDLGF